MPHYSSKSLFIPTAALTAIATLAACSKGDAQANKHQPGIPTPVYVRVVAEEAGLQAARYSGNVEPATKVELAFKVGGHVESITEVTGTDGRRHVLQDGDKVAKGSVLAVVKQSDYQARLESARSSLAEAKASERQAQLDFDRSTKLLASKSVSQAETDGMSVKLDVAKARVAGALSRVREATLALEDCTVRAPMSGVIAGRAVEVGTLVGAGSPAFVIVDTSNMKVVFGAPDRMVERLVLGRELDVEVPAIAGHFKGRISRIAPTADKKSRVFDVETTLANPSDQLKVGMVASLSVPEGATEAPQLALPLTSVLRSKNDARGFSVFVVEGDVAKAKDVSLGDILGNQVLVKGGLTRGERVVSMGASLLVDGSKVRIIPAVEK